jgi:hypothetical protein
MIVTLHRVPTEPTGSAELFRGPVGIVAGDVEYVGRRTL